MRLLARRSAGSLFFFQAEDGIRDLTVTGVQTCALPIYHQAGEYRTKSFLPARGQERHPTCLLPDRDEESDENEVEQVGRKELRKLCAKCAQTGRTLDHGAPNEEEEWSPEQRQEVPLRTGAPREVAPAKVADSVLAVGDPRDQERPAGEGDERQEKDRRLRRDFDGYEAETQGP